MAENHDDPAGAGPSTTTKRSATRPRPGGPKTTPASLRPADWIRGVEAIKFGANYHMKLMLLAIARGSATDGSGVCTHLSQAHLAVAAEVHPDHVWRLVKRAEEMELLVSRKRHDKMGKRRHTEYQLTITPLRENDDLLTEQVDRSASTRRSKRKMSDGSTNRHVDAGHPTSDSSHPTFEAEPSDLQGMSEDHLVEHPEVDHPSDHHLEDSERRARARGADPEDELREGVEEEADDQTAPKVHSPQPDDASQDDDSPAADDESPEGPSDIEDPDVVFTRQVMSAIGDDMVMTAHNLIPEATDLELAQMIEAIAANVRRGVEPPSDFPITKQQADAMGALA